MRGVHVVLAFMMAAAMLITVSVAPDTARAIPGSFVIGQQYPCTRDGLAAAIADGGAQVSIAFDCESPRIDFYAGDVITVSNRVDIFGSNNGNQIILDGNGQTSFFNVEENGRLDLFTLILQHGAAQLDAEGFHQGGAINSAGSILIETSTFRENYSSEYGGAISSSGNLTILRSTFIDNRADVHGGALDLSAGVTALKNTTLSGNTAGELGSAINFHPDTVTAVGWLTIVQPQHTSPALTTSPYVPLPGAPPDDAPPDPVMLHVGSSLLGGYGDHCEFQTEIIVQFTESLANDDSCARGETADWENQSLLLGTLWQTTFNDVSYGYHPLLIGSPAIDASSCTEFDQLGINRPIGTACEIGAVEGAILYDTTTLCANHWTGTVAMPNRDDCGRNDSTLLLPTYFDSTFCVNSWNGQPRASDQCSRSEHLVTITGNHETSLCINRWSGAVRISDRCTRSERQTYL